MLFSTHRSRRLFAGANIVALAFGGVIKFKRFGPFFQLDVPSYRQKGPSQAPVKIVEFSDFQCPACRSAIPPIKNIMRRYPDKIHLTFKHFLLEKIHRWARTAAEAADCAGEQDKFWEFHDILFERQEFWSKTDKAPEILHSYAREIGLDPSRFTACIQSPQVSAAIEKDKQDAANQAVKSTPTFFINGKRFVGAKQLQAGGFAEIRRGLKK